MNGLKKHAKKGAAFFMALALTGATAPITTPAAPQTLQNGYEIDLDNLPKVHFSAHPEWEEVYNASWNLHKDRIKKAPIGLNPEDVYYIDENYNDTIFVWDTMLMMLFDKYGLNEFPTLESIDNFYYHQKDLPGNVQDGYICRQIWEDGREQDRWNYTDQKNTGTNPPLFAMAEWEQYQIHGDVSRFSKVINGKTIFERLESHYDYIEREKKMENELYGKTNGYGNGLDNTPNQDDVNNSQSQAGKQTYNDLSIQQAQAAWYLSLIADAMGNTEKAEYFREEHERISDLINEKLWSDDAKMYSNLDENQNKTNISTPTNLWALPGHVATEEHAEEIIKNHGFNSQKLYRPGGLATLAYDWNDGSSRFVAEGGYWRGAVWAPTSYQYVYGLREYGYDQLAFEEAVRHVNMVSDVYKSTGTIWENYSSDYTKPGRRENGGSEAKGDFCGWAGSFSIGMVLEDLIGVGINAPDNTITWNVHLTEDFGVDNLYMKHDGVENRVSLHADQRTAAASDLNFTATTEEPVTLVVKAAGTEETFDLEPGTHSYTVTGTADGSEQPGSIGYKAESFEDAYEKVSKDFYDKQALDYVYFGTEKNDEIKDGIPYQTGEKNGLLFNINTVGDPLSQNGGYLEASEEMKDLGYEEAQSVVKTWSKYGDNGFMFMAPASTKLQIMRLVVGVKNGSAKLLAGLNDGSSKRVEQSFEGDSEESIYVIDVPFRAAEDNSYVLVQWLLDGGDSSTNPTVSVKSVALLKDLSEYKAEAKDALTGYKAESLYLPEQAEELRQAIAAGILAIEKASDPDDVEKALAAAKKTIDAIQTAEQLKPDEPSAETITATNVSLSQTTLTYNGKVQTPAITAKDKNGKTVTAANYTSVYTNNINVGTASVTITFNGSYTGTVQKTFQIIPKGTSISKLTAKKNGFTVKWKKQNTQTDGYEIQYAANAKFKGKKTMKNIKVKTTSKTVSKLKAKKKYYVQIRTYKKVGGTKYYSDWSKPKKVTTKS